VGFCTVHRDIKKQCYYQCAMLFPAIPGFNEPYIYNCDIIIMTNHLHCLTLINISEPTRLRRPSYAVFCLQKKNLTQMHPIMNSDLMSCPCNICNYCPSHTGFMQYNYIWIYAPCSTCGCLIRIMHLDSDNVVTSNSSSSIYCIALHVEQWSTNEGNSRHS